MSLLAKLRGALGRAGATPRPREDLSNPALRTRFFEAANRLPREARVIEFGTRQSVKGRATHVHGAMLNVPRANYLMSDIDHGDDVDVVADLHALPADWTNRFDAVVAIAVFEHLERPWIAAKEVARVLAPGGIGFIATHQTFPLHGYPSDFFRFSKEALALIFADAGLRIVEAGYQHRADIVPPPEVVRPRDVAAWNDRFPSYIVVDLFVEKVSASGETGSREETPRDGP